MREIKFRAWHKKFKFMVRVSGIDMICYDEIRIQYPTVNIRTKSGCIWTNLENVELMQYTGLKDKNGVEIYEGDIVRYAEFNCPVLWSKDLMWCIDINNGYGEEMLTAYFDYELEVIGNIYENKELLV